MISTSKNFLKRTNSFFRFLLVGVVNTFIGLSVIFIFMNVFELSYWVSTFTGNSIGAAVSFLLNRKFTFNSNTSLKKGGMRFVAVILVCYFLSFTLSKQMINWKLFELNFLFTSPKNASVVIGTIFYTMTNYTGQKYFVFFHGKTTEIIS